MTESYIENPRLKLFIDSDCPDSLQFKVSITILTDNIYTNDNIVSEDTIVTYKGLQEIPLSNLKGNYRIMVFVSRQFVRGGDNGSYRNVTSSLEYLYPTKITIWADDKNKCVYDEDPELTWKITSGDPSLRDQLTGIKITREPGNEVGKSYKIHPSQEEGANPDFKITFVDGTMWVNEYRYHGRNIYPQKTEVGYNSNCWEDVHTGKFYYDQNGEDHAHPTVLLFYDQLKTDPVYELKDFERADRFDVWCPERRVTFDCQWNYPVKILLGSEKADGKYYNEFLVTGKDVDNGIVKWYRKSSYGKGIVYNVKIYVNGTVAYALDNVAEDDYVAHLPGLKTGDIVKFEVEQCNEANLYDSDDFHACLCYTRTDDFAYLPLTLKLDDVRKGTGVDDPEFTWTVDRGYIAEQVELPQINITREAGEEPGTYRVHAAVADGVETPYDITFVDGSLTIHELIHHPERELSRTQYGYNQECWENTENGKLYADQAMTKELSPAEVITYHDVVKNSVILAQRCTEFESKDYEGVNYRWGAEKLYDKSELYGAEVTFEVKDKYAKDARLKWYNGDSKGEYGKFNCYIRVNDELVYEYHQDGAMNAHNALALPELKQGDKVRFLVQNFDIKDESVKIPIAACLEYALSEEKLFIPVTLTADNKTRSLDAADPELTYTITEGKTISGYELPGITISRENGNECGEYGIHIALVSNEETAYDISLADAKLEILKVVYHPEENATEHTVGYIQECWEHKESRRFFSTADCYQSLNSVSTIIYAAREHHSEDNTVGFNLEVKATYEDVLFNRAFQHDYAASDESEDYVKFTIDEFGVDNARIKWYKNFTSEEAGNYTVQVFNGDDIIYTFNQDDVKKDEKFFEVLLGKVNKGKEITFKVKKEAWTSEGNDFTIAACLEYTTMIPHMASAPTISERGYTQDCFEDPLTKKLYKYDDLRVELNPALICTYVPQAEDPVVGYWDFDVIGKSTTFQGVPFNWAASTAYDDMPQHKRYVTYEVHGTNIDHPRMKVANVSGTYGSDLQFNIYVNNNLYVSFIPEYFRIENSDIVAFDLQKLKPSDFVRFEIEADYGRVPDHTPDGVGNNTIKGAEFWVSLEFTRISDDDGYQEVAPTLFLEANEDPDNEGNYYTTFYDDKSEYTVSEGATAYTGTFSNGVLLMQPLSDNIIPAGEAVLIKSETGSVQLVISHTEAAKSKTNDLHGTTLDIEAPENTYILTYAQNGLGFYHYAAGKTLSAYKAYLTYSSEVEAKGVRMVFGDEATEIVSVPVSNNDGAIYNLAGQRISHMQRGINIVNGKKVFRK